MIFVTTFHCFVLLLMFIVCFFVLRQPDKRFSVEFIFLDLRKQSMISLNIYAKKKQTLLVLTGRYFGRICRKQKKVIFHLLS